MPVTVPTGPASRTVVPPPPPAPPGTAPPLLLPGPAAPLPAVGPALSDEQPITSATTRVMESRGTMSRYHHGASSSTSRSERTSRSSSERNPLWPERESATERNAVRAHIRVVRGDEDDADGQRCSASDHQRARHYVGVVRLGPA